MNRLPKKIFLLATCYSLLATLTGCATIADIPKGIAGISTKMLEEGRKEAIRKQFNYDYNTCYNKVKKSLEKEGSYIYAQSIKKHMLALYVSEEDTTPVGIFFKEIDTNNTQIEVSSPSKFAKEFIAKEVSSIFDRLQKMEAKINAEKEMGNK
jgi:hypothetical protein